MRSTPMLAFLLVAAAGLSGCDAPDRGAPPERGVVEPGGEHDADHDHADHADHAGHHVHKAPHGGALVVLQDEALNLELLVDATSGGLTAWVLDGECENPVRITQDAIELSLTLNGSAVAVRLDAVENALTGEKKGDTSQFAGRHDGLRGAGKFSGVVRSVQIGPRAFQSVKFEYAVPHR